MYFNGSTCSDHHFILVVDEPENLLRRLDALNDSFQYMARALRDILVQEFEILKAQQKSLKDRKSQQAANVDEDINIEDKESELDQGRAEPTEYQTKDLFT